MRDEMHQLIRLLFQVASDALTAYKEHKHDSGVIDFIDQETKALELLRRPDVRAELARQIDLVLIDEFQDTSPIQLAIFLELASLAAESIWVGDPKQAIFGFRGTDPALMDAAIESLTSTTTDPDLVAEAVRAVSGGRLERLDTSYRSRPELVAVTSEIFAPAFAHQGMPEERTRLQANLKANQEPEGLGHSFEYWPLDPAGRTGGEPLADAVAAGVRELLARATPVRDRNDGTARPTRPSDVAVLCRTNKQCQWVANALAALGVPAVVPQMELLDTAEATLVMAGLRLWVDPGDALAAAEVARLVSYPADLDGLVARVLDEPGPGAFRDDPAVAAIVAARVRSPDTGPIAAIDAVIAAGDLRALCAAWGNSEQRLANLDALRSHAVSYAGESSASGAAVTLVGLLRYLESMVDTWGWDARRTDSQALRADAPAVTLSTWHRAKGLEWPVTILFGLETLRAPQAHGTHVMTDRQGFDVADPLGGRWIRFWPNPYSNAVQNGPVKTAFQGSQAYGELVARADREALRILYVGWTRARDRLILAVQRGKLKGGLVGKLGTLNPPLISEPPAATPAGDAVVTWAGRDVTISVAPSAPAMAVVVANEPGTVTVGRPAIARAPARMLPSAAAPVPLTPGETVVLGERIPVRGGGVDMTAIGNAVHAFLAADRPALLADERLAMADAILRRFRVNENLEASDLLEVASRLWRWIDARFTGGRLHREWPVLLRTPAGTVLSGTADLVVTTPAGIVVIDHKTFPGLNQAALARAQTYSGQLAAYSAAVCAATGAPPASTWIHFPILGQVVEVSL
ncbi:MAG TPA: UvrD-helicase domain-containing protein, partial [Polyangia bacterium]|nr:UvrD-helicase domain-containing protein [Polyangia bacterium]